MDAERISYALRPRIRNVYELVTFRTRTHLHTMTADTTRPRMKSYGVQIPCISRPKRYEHQAGCAGRAWAYLFDVIEPTDSGNTVSQSLRGTCRSSPMLGKNKGENLGESIEIRGEIFGDLMRFRRPCFSGSSRSRKVPERLPGHGRSKITISIACALPMAFFSARIPRRTEPRHYG